MNANLVCSLKNGLFKPEQQNTSEHFKQNSKKWAVVNLLSVRNVAQQSFLKRRRWTKSCAIQISPFYTCVVNRKILSDFDSKMASSWPKNDMTDNKDVYPVKITLFFFSMNVFRVDFFHGCCLLRVAIRDVVLVLTNKNVQICDLLPTEN